MTAVQCNRMIVNLCTDRLAESRDFYQQLLDLQVAFESDWYIQLTSDRSPNLELGLIQRTHELVPTDYQHPPTGTYLTFVVDDVDAVYARAIEQGRPIVQVPKNEFYGQRRFLTIEPSGCLVDISTPYPMAASSVG